MTYSGFWNSGDEGTPDSQNAGLLQYGTFANRPAAAKEGVHFFATDTEDMYRDNGTTWDLLGHVGDKSCRVYHSTTQSLSDDVLTTISLNSEQFDTDTMHDTVTNNERITIKTAGKYLIVGEISFSANATGMRLLILRFNDGGTEDTVALDRSNAIINDNQTSLLVVAILDMAVNDYVFLRARQDSGAALDVDGGQDDIMFQAIRTA